jgi:N-acetylglucosamine-6-sulfatase
MRWTQIGCLTFIISVCSGIVLAQCTLEDEAIAVKKSVRKATKCNNEAFLNGPNPNCKQAAPPVCSSTLSPDAVALGYGPNNPPASAVDAAALAAQISCQNQIGKAITKYIWKKLDALVLGIPADEAEKKASKQLNLIPDFCTVPVVQDTSGVILPAVGPQCAAAIGAPGSNVDPAKLRDCLHTLLQVWVDRYGPNPQPLKPNIVFILTDDQRWDTTDSKHSLSGTDIMPNVRAELAMTGVEFSNAFMTTPLCCPSRSSILLGEYAHNTGVHGNMLPNGGATVFPDASTLGTMFQSAGYRTGFIGKYLNQYNKLWDETIGEPPYVPPGWNDWRVFKSPKYYDYELIENGVSVPYGSTEAEYSTDVLRDNALAFIDSAATDGVPFFLYFDPKAPHGPWIPAPRHAGMFAGLQPWRPPSYNEADVSDKPLWLQNTPLLTPAEQANLDGIRISQLEMLQAVDEAVASIMQSLRDHNLASNTLVVYFADNGWLWGEHRRQAKNVPYEEAIRSPMFVYYPSLTPLPRVDQRFALNIDLAPTFAELIGAPPPATPDGASLVKVLDDTQQSWRNDFMTEGYPASRQWATIREDEWKYTEYPDGEAELYNLTTDPYELTNVVTDPANADCVTRMAARIREIRPDWPNDVNFGGEDPDD